METDRYANGPQYHPCESSTHLRSSRTPGIALARFPFFACFPHRNMHTRVSFCDLGESSSDDVQSVGDHVGLWDERLGEVSAGKSYADDEWGYEEW